MTTKHAVVCKRDGFMIGFRLEGGVCVCPADRCLMAEERAIGRQAEYVKSRTDASNATRS
jgi:hypothetical protein